MLSLLLRMWYVFPFECADCPWKFLQPIEDRIEIVRNIRVVQMRTVNDDQRNAERVGGVRFRSESSGFTRFFRHYAIDLPIFPKRFIQFSGIRPLHRKDPRPRDSER